MSDCRLLVVDDTQEILDLLVAVFGRRPGFAVVGQAGNGQEAIERAGDTQPDVVVLDVAMPVMDGLEALPLIRTAAPDSRVLIFSGFLSSDTRARATAAGAGGFVPKGCTVGELVEAVRGACASG